MKKYLVLMAMFFMCMGAGFAANTESKATNENKQCYNVTSRSASTGTVRHMTVSAEKLEIYLSRLTDPVVNIQPVKCAGSK